MIIEHIGKVAYMLELPASATIHPVFHVSQLRRAICNCVSSPVIPAQSEELVLQADILDVRNVGPGGTGQLEVLVKWKDLANVEASWENLEALKLQFPHAHLEDKVRLYGGGIGKPPLRFTYMRRNKV